MVLNQQDCKPEEEDSRKERRVKEANEKDVCHGLKDNISMIYLVLKQIFKKELNELVISP